MKEVLVRSKYDLRIRPFIGKSLIKVLIGQRRVGKSYLLKQVQAEIAAKTDSSNIILVDKESEDFRQIVSDIDLSAYITSEAVTEDGVMNYVFIDEVQEIKDFENSIRSFAAQPNYDIYITGSNSEILSGELATRLSGRYIEIQVYSLDFNEFVEFHNLVSNQESLNLYLKYGGMPFLRNLELTDELVFEYLKNVFTSILYRDILTRYNIRNVNFLDRLIRFTADNIGSILKAKNINDYLKSQKVNISVNTVMDYLTYLVNSQVLVPVKRIDLKGKRNFEIGEKYYFQDLGLRNGLSGFRISDIGKLIENCVFNHLISHGYVVFTGDWQKLEIDFVAEKNNERVYIQVAYLLTEQSTIDREFGNLALIRDNYRKMVVSMDAQLTNTVNGIEHWNLLRFLQEF